MIQRRGYLNNMKKIVITGSSGFIGTNLLAHFGKKYEIQKWDIKEGCDVFNNGFEQVVKWADVVIHLAALTSVEQSFKNPDEVFKTNVMGTARVAYLCHKYKKKLIYPSSAAIYHPELSPYAKSKKIAEDVVLGLMKKTPVTILRLYNVFGPHMNPDSGSIMYNFLTSKKIVVYGDGEQTRDFVHVRDVCGIIEAAISNKWNGIIVDVGLGQHFSVNYVAALFAHYRKLKIEYKPPRREIKWSISDPTIRLMLYMKPMTTDMEKDIKDLCLHQ